MKKVYISILGLIFALLFVNSAVFSESLKIPDFFQFEYLCDDEAVISQNYYKNYLLQIADFCGWDFELIPEITLNSFEKMLRGELDLVYDVAKSSERKEQGFIFSKIPCLTYHIFLVSLPNDSRFNSVSLENLDGKTIGYSEGDPFEKQLLEDFAKTHGLNINIVAVSYTENTSDAIIAHNLDLCVTARLTSNLVEKVIYDFGNFELYFASSSPAVIEKLDSAVDALFAKNPFFLLEILAKGSDLKIFDGTNPTESEIAFLKNNSPFTVLDDDNYAKQLFLETDVKKAFWSLVSEFCGAEFNLKTKENFVPKNNEIYLYEVSSHEKSHQNAENSNISYTDNFFVFEVCFVCSREKSISDFFTQTTTPKIAITSDIKKVLPYFEERLGNFEIVVEENPENCIKMLSKSEYDAILINATYLQQRYKLSDYRTLTDAEVVYYKIPMCMAVVGKDSEKLTSILNRAFSQLPQDYYSKRLEKEGIFVQTKPSLERKINFALLVSLILLVVIFVNTIVLTFRHTRLGREAIFKDSLTGLLSLQGIEFGAEKLFRQSHYKKQFLLSELNIRDFSSVNHIYGQQKGDKIILTLAAALKQKFPAQTDDILVARGYADVFYILIPMDSSEAEILKYMRGIQLSLQDFVNQKENVKIILKSGNVFCGTAKNTTLKDIISKATYARRSNRDSVIENFSVFTQELSEQRETEEMIENEIEEALQKEEFVVHFQPKLSLKDGKICGAEALVRWNRLGKKSLSPDKFIPILEKSGLVGKLDDFVYETVFRYMSYLRQSSFPIIPISMNISRLNYDIRTFVDKLDRLTLKYDVPRRFIELEIEERFAGANDTLVKNLVDALHKSGYSVSMDDFGSGQSTLNMLSEIQVDTIKFDQGFLRTSLDSNDARVVLTAMITMVRALGRHSLCEGVETEEQIEFLRTIGCEIVQGFYYSKPLSATEFKEFLRTHV